MLIFKSYKPWCQIDCFSKKTKSWHFTSNNTSHSATRMDSNSWINFWKLWRFLSKIPDFFYDGNAQSSNFRSMSVVYTIWETIVILEMIWSQNQPMIRSTYDVSKSLIKFELANQPLREIFEVCWLVQSFNIFFYSIWYYKSLFVTYHLLWEYQRQPLICHWHFQLCKHQNCW